MRRAAALLFVYGGNKVGTVFLCIGCFVVGSMVGIGIMCLMIVGGADSERGRDCNNEDRQDKEG